jgi:hypothetical protein
LNRFRACGKKWLRTEPHDGEWYGGKRFSLTSVRRSYDAKRWKFFDELKSSTKGQDKVFDANVRREYNNYTVFTNDTGLLDHILHQQDVVDDISYIRFTSERYEEEINKLGDVPFDVVFRKNVHPSQLYKCYIKSGTNGYLSSLANYICNNREHFNIDDDLLQRMLSNGYLWVSDHYFYCDDFDSLTMAIMIGGNRIRKIYKTIQKEEQR